MKTLLLAGGLLLAGCATTDQRSDIITLPAAIAAEKAVQQRCPRNVAERMTLLNSRALADAALGPRLSASDWAALNEIRRETDRVCPVVPLFQGE